VWRIAAACISTGEPAQRILGCLAAPKCVCRTKGGQWWCPLRIAAIAEALTFLLVRHIVWVFPLMALQLCGLATSPNQLLTFAKFELAMILTVCLPPPPAAVLAEVRVPSCRTFSDLQHLQEWLKEHQITLPCQKL